MKHKATKQILSLLLAVVMLVGMLPVAALTVSAATINAVWWTDASDMTDFTASFDSTWISSGDWYKLMKYDEARGFYALSPTE